MLYGCPSVHMQRAPILALQNGREAFRSVSRPSGYTKITGIKTIVDYDQVSLWHRLRQIVIRQDVTVAALLPEGKVRRNGVGVNLQAVF